MTVNVRVQPLPSASLKGTPLPALEKLLQPLQGEMLLVPHVDEKLSLELIISRPTRPNPGAQGAVVR